MSGAEGGGGGLAGAVPCGALDDVIFGMGLRRAVALRIGKSTCGREWNVCASVARDLCRFIDHLPWTLFRQRVSYAFIGSATWDLRLSYLLRYVLWHDPLQKLHRPNLFSLFLRNIAC